MTKAKKLSLEQVRKNFTNWRNSKTSRYQAIPKELWVQALALIKNYTTIEISRALHISQKQIQRELDRKNISTSSKFVEFKIPSAELPTNSINNSSKIELKKANGESLIIEQPTIDIVALICGKFLGNYS